MIHGYYGGFHPGILFLRFPLFEFIFGILLLTLAVYVTVLIVKKIKNRATGVHYRSDDPLYIAKQRYARGEISEVEYKQIIEGLTRL